ncbi:MAG: DUF6691 family protein [Gammaproteobacteria bacterium]
MKYNFIALFCGLIFGIGLSLSQMINPNKVLNFLDITGNWDPSLIFVMIGALAVAFVSFKLILKRPAPILAENFHISRRSSVDKPLILGAAIFGTGWGMSGYCPGPAVTGLGLLSVESVIMVITIYLGFFACNLFFERK